MYNLIESAPDGLNILGSFSTEEEAVMMGKCFSKSPVCDYYITKFLTKVW